MSAKHSASEDDKPAAPCLTESELQQVKDAVKGGVVISDHWSLLLKPGAIGMSITFIIGCTWSVAVFMHEARAFQRDTTEALETNRKAILVVSNQLAVVTQKQNNVIGDRWRFSDMQPWTYQLEKANRDVMREGGGKGIVVPEPVAKRAEP